MPKLESNPTPKYLKSAYIHLIHRCYNPSSAFYNKLTMCLRWRLGEEYFVADVGERPSDKHSLVLTPGATEYNKNTVKWSVNRTGGNPYHKPTPMNMVEIDGVVKNVSDWARELNIKLSTVYARVKQQNITVKEALELGSGRIPRTDKGRTCIGLTKEINRAAKLESALGNLNRNIERLDTAIEQIKSLATTN